MNAIRPATGEDMPRLVRYADAFLDYHPMTAKLPRDLAAMERTLASMMESDNAVLLVHDAGAIGGVLTPVWSCPDALLAVELFWWAERDGLRLMRAFEAWADARGAIPQMTGIQGVRDVAPLYERAGYVAVETAYVRRPH